MMNFIELLEKRGVKVDDVSCIAVSRQGFMVSTFPNELFPHLEYDGRLMELTLWLPDLKRRVYWCIDEISITKNVKLTREED